MLDPSESAAPWHSFAKCLRVQEQVHVSAFPVSGSKQRGKGCVGERAVCAGESVGILGTAAGPRTLPRLQSDAWRLYPVPCAELERAVFSVLAVSPLHS